MRFHKTYFILAALLFLTEAGIAAFFHDSFIRPFFGDFLVVMLVYTFIQAFFRLRVIPAALGVLAFACLIEWGQYLHILDYLHLQHSGVARLVLGTYFSWLDILAYELGTLTIILAERLLRASRNARQSVSS